MFELFFNLLAHLLIIFSIGSRLQILTFVYDIGNISMYLLSKGSSSSQNNCEETEKRAT
mgnify:CR=1 FL=1